MTTTTDLPLCGRLSERGYPCELMRDHGGLCDWEDARFDWEKESPADPEESTHERAGCYSNGDPR